MHVLTAGAGTKRSAVAPGPDGMQLWPRNAYGGGHPCIGSDGKPTANNTCATYDWTDTKKTKREWSLNRAKANPGFGSLHASETELLVRIFEWVPVEMEGRAPDTQLAEVVSVMLTR